MLPTQRLRFGLLSVLICYVAWPSTIQAEELCSQYVQTRKLDLAVEACTQEIKKSPTAANLNNRGRAYDGKALYDTAIADFNESIRLKRDFKYAYTNRGNAYRKKGKYGPAISDYTSAIGIDPDYALAYSNRGTVYLQLGQYDQARADFDKAISLNPKMAAAFVNCGFVLYKDSRYNRAILNYTRAMALAPKSYQSYNNLAWLYATCKDKRYRNGKKAVKLALKAVSLNQSLATLDTLAAAYVQNRQDRLAEKTYGKAMQVDTNAIKIYQQSLLDKNCSSGSVDGVLSRQVKNAISKCVARGQFLE